MSSIRPRIPMLGLPLVLVAMAAVAASSATGGSAAAPKGPQPAFAPLRTPPVNAVSLFNGRDLRNWHQRDGRPAAWKIKDGMMTAMGGDIVTNQTFADAFIHVEFREPQRPDRERGNSGVYVQGRYEI
jgi:hypothetical protein